jgi:oligoendopeptidase F
MAQERKAEAGEVWKLDGLLGGRSPEELLQEVDDAVKRFAAHRKELDTLTPNRLADLLKEKEGLGVLSSRLGAYYELKFNEDTHDPVILAKMTLLEQRSMQWENDLLFFPLWFIGLDDEKALRFINDPFLQEYRYALERLRKRKSHTRNEEVEKVLSIKDVTGGGAAANLYEVITNAYTFDFDGRKEVGKEEVIRHIQGPDARLREEAYKTVLGRYVKESTVLAEIYKTVVLDYDNEAMEIRNYRDAIGVRNLGNDVPDAAVEALFRSVRKHAPLFQRYFKAKYALITGKGKATYPYSRFHLYAPYEFGEEKRYPYEESKRLVLDTFKRFDPRFHDAAKALFDTQHIHSHPGERKRGGAFCYSVHAKETPFVLLNHTDRLRDVFTMAHELGHAIHGTLAQKQNDVNYHAPTPLAETASIFAEMLLSQALLKESKDDEERIRILVHELDGRYASILRQAYFSIFEVMAHERIKEGATKQELEDAYVGLLREQFGDMELPEEFRNEWNYIPHIHASPFYCYSYAWGELLVLSLYERYRKEGPSFIKRYEELLAAGGSASPETLLSRFGVDPKDERFWDQGFALIEEEVREFERLAGKKADS